MFLVVRVEKEEAVVQSNTQIEPLSLAAVWITSQVWQGWNYLDVGEMSPGA